MKIIITEFKIIKMKKIKLTESQLKTVIQKIISEQVSNNNETDTSCVKNFKFDGKQYRSSRNDEYHGIFKLDGTCTVMYSESAMLVRDGKWKCENEKLLVTNLSQPRLFNKI